MKTIFLLLLIAASFGTFFLVIKPKYDSLLTIRNEVNSFDGNLQTAEKLKQSRDELISKYNSIPKADLDGLKALLPDSVDNIRLIIQLDSLATRNGLSKLRNVDYKVAAVTKPGTNTTDKTETQTPESRKPYGEFVISFQTVGQYKNFLSFINDLERNLRLVDITAVTFDPVAANSTEGPVTNMSYKVTLKTYWLKQ